MANTTNMNLDLPEVGTTTVNDAASKLVVALEGVDSHDHSSGEGVKITPAGININTTLDVNNNKITAVNALNVTELTTALVGASNINTVMSVNGELYFTDGTGVSVQVTANGGLDTTVSGGWTGDYGATDAEATYIDASKVFKLMQDGNNNQAGVFDIGDIKLRTTVANAVNYLTLKSPTLSSSWALTFPTSAPGSTSIMSMDSSGVIVNTRDPSVDTITTTGAATVGGTLGVTGTSTLAVVTATTVNGVDPSSLAARHVTGGADEIDGDKLDIDWTPSNYTPTTSPAEASSLDNLTAHLAGIDAAIAAGVSDHGALTGLGDDDHTQYHNNTRGDTRYYQQSEFLNTSAGAGDSGKPVKLDAGGKLDASMLNDSDVDHGSIGGLGDDDHTQYILANGTRALTGAINGTALSLSSTLGVTGISTLAAVTATTITASSLITANGGVTAGSGDDITVQGSGEFKHGDRELVLSAVGGGSGSGSSYVVGGTGGVVSGDMYITIPLIAGDVITSIKYAANGNGSGTKTFRFYTTSFTTGTTTSINTDAKTTTGHYTSTVNVTDTTITNTKFAFVRFQVAVSTDKFYGIVVTYNHP